MATREHDALSAGACRQDCPRGWPRRWRCAAARDGKISNVQLLILALHNIFPSIPFFGSLAGRLPSPSCQKRMCQILGILPGQQDLICGLDPLYLLRTLPVGKPMTMHLHSKSRRSHCTCLLPQHAPSRALQLCRLRSA